MSSSVSCLREELRSGQIDCVNEPNMDGEHFDVTLDVAYTGDHYMSIVDLASPQQCAIPCEPHAIPVAL